MKTEELIAVLSRATQPDAPKSPLRRFGLVSLIGLLIGLIVLKLSYGFRPDIGIAAPIVALKAGMSALIATCALGVAQKLAGPSLSGDGQLRRALAPLAVLIGELLVLGLVTLANTQSGQRFEAFMGGGFPWCILTIPALGLPCAIGLLWVVRDCAPTRLALAGASIGAVSGGLGAMVYAMFCPVDSVAFVTIWYVAGIGVSAAIGALLGQRLLRW
jgi:hypothetical protein